ncbi:Rap1a/Tai family immunity protein [Xylophilus sp. GOD-11R]|uniref:Rap1a/Tai family immunity protein n=1 Tax=Xylophilus sp. GOD-11R TaxID=3089814 RepID=UPI00298C4985|nr:Rap1a/Tai family immunity protein [Xylophilus sp. GOD-11R]WPB58023.1 Rap1a/Tai family immunity protein [Xylophilus sp. GOD-11R]
MARSLSAAVLAGGICQTISAAEMTAGAVAARCRPDAKSAACIATMDGFLAGYVTGIQKGIRSTFSQDPLVLQTTDGNEDTYLRYRKIEQRTLCLPNGIEAGRVAAVFIDFLNASPDTSSEPFGDVMEVALDTAFAC